MYLNLKNSTLWIAISKDSDSWDQKIWKFDPPENFEFAAKNCHFEKYSTLSMPGVLIASSINEKDFTYDD